MMRVMFLYLFALGVILSGCDLAPDAPSPTAQAPLSWRDVSPLVYGICFEAAFDEQGQTFVLRDEAALNQLFDLADTSRLCRRPVERVAYSFQPGEVIIGIWRVGRGCTAHYQINPLEQDALTGTIRVPIQFITEGNCDYELLRPLWLAVSGVGAAKIEFRQDA